MISRRKFINLSIASFVIVSSKETFAEGKKLKNINYWLTQQNTRSVMMKS